MRFWQSSNAVDCPRCTKTHGPNSWRAVERLPFYLKPREEPIDVESEYHLECALDQFPRAFAEAAPSAMAVARAAGAPILELEAIEQVMHQRLRAIEQRASQRVRYVRAGTGSQPRTTTVFPVVLKDEEEVISPPARDPQGRPRVKVLCCGSACSPDTGTGIGFWNALRVTSWPSAKRDYQFVFMSDFFELPEEDPSQPVIATLYGAVAMKNSHTTGERMLSLWGALGLAPPLIWLLGISSKKPRDPQTLRFRELVRSCGLSADESPVLCEPKISTDALDRLVAALDEYVDPPRELRHVGDVSLGAAQLLAREWSSRDIEHWAREMPQRAELACRGNSPQTAELLHSLVAELIAAGEWRAAGPLLARGAANEREFLRSWIEQLLASAVDWLPFEFHRICWLLGDIGGTVPTDLVLRRFIEESQRAGRSVSLDQQLAVLLDYGTKEELAQLRDATSQTPQRLSAETLDRIEQLLRNGVPAKRAGARPLIPRL